MGIEPKKDGILMNLVKLIWGIIMLVYTIIIEIPFVWIRWHCSRKYRINVWEQQEGKKWIGK